MGGKIIIQSITFRTLAKARSWGFSPGRWNSVRCCIPSSRASSHRRTTTTNWSFVTHDRSDSRPRHGIVLRICRLIEWWVMLVTDGWMGIVFWNMWWGSWSWWKIRRRSICCSWWYQHWRGWWMLSSRYPRLQSTCYLRFVQRLNMTTLSRSMGKEKTRQFKKRWVETE